MNLYDNQYYFIHRSFDQKNLPSLNAHLKTQGREYYVTPPQPFSAPLFFINGSRNLQKQYGYPIMKIPPDILFNGYNMVIPTAIREALIEYDLPHLNMHPTVYIHDDGEWHEGLWYITFTEYFDCWDKSASNYDRDDPPINGDYLVYDFSIDQKLFDQIPLEKRLLFKVGATSTPYIVAHEKLVKKIFSKGYTGITITKVADGTP